MNRFHFSQKSTLVAIALVYAWVAYSAASSSEMGYSAVPGRIIAWGDNYANLSSNTPKDHTFVAVAAGGYHGIALRADGSLVGWGNNSDGQTNCPAGTNYIAITAGQFHSLALRSDGTVIGWGRNTNNEINCPPGEYIAIAAESTYSLAIRSDGSLVAWGRVSEVVTNTPSGTNYIAIATGISHALALRSDGSLVGWGVSNDGQTNCPPGNDFVAIAAEGTTSFALRSDGAVLSWGRESTHNIISNTPKETTHVAIAAGGFHGLVLRSDGSLYSWGANWYTQTNVPSGTDYVAIAAGTHWSVAITLFLPYVCVTNDPVTVSFDVESYTVAGTNNANVIGGMSWTNALTGDSGMCAAAVSWSAQDIPLGVGANIITVIGTNAAGAVSTDFVTITRQRPTDATWNGQGADDNTLTDANWVEEYHPLATPDSIMRFGGETRTHVHINYPDDAAFGTLLFKENAGDFTLSGSALSIYALIENTSDHLQDIAINLTIADETEFNALNDDLVFSGALSGDEPVRKTGSETICFTDADRNDDFTGTLTVEDGRVAGLGVKSSDVTVDNGGGIAPGSATGAIGVFETADLTLNDGSYIDWEYDDATADLIAVNGALILNGEVIVKVNKRGDVINTERVLFMFTVAPSEVSNLTFDISEAEGVTAAWATIVGNTVVVTLIPEPGMFAIALLAACALFRWHLNL